MNSNELWKYVAGGLRKEESLSLPTPDELRVELEGTVTVILSKERMEEILMFATNAQGIKN